MRSTGQFPFEKSRRITAREVEDARRAIQDRTGEPRRRRGRPPKGPDWKYLRTTIRLHPRAVAWARAEAARRGVGYQTVINEVLLQRAG
jgi:uncharacterized protein (DUF4415 family)